MLSPISTTGHLVRSAQRQPALEVALILGNCAAYTFALLNFLTTLG
jgi:hypothetical protein